MAKLTKDQIMAMSDDQIMSMMNNFKQQQIQSVAPATRVLPTQSPLAGLGRAIAMAGQAYTTGKVPDEAFKTQSMEPNWYAKQQFEQQTRQSESEKEFERKKELAKYEAELKPLSGQKVMRVGDNLVSVNPATGESEVLFEAKGKAGKTISAPMVERISNQANSYYGMGDALNMLEGNASKYKQFMGPGKDILRNPMRSYVNKDLSDFLAWQANVQDSFQQYRKAITGAQASAKELEMLERNRPSEKDTYETFKTKTKVLQDVGAKVIKRYFSNLEKAGYDVRGFQEDIGLLDTEGVDTEGINREGEVFTAPNDKKYKIIHGGDPDDPDVSDVMDNSKMRLSEALQQPSDISTVTEKPFSEFNIFEQQKKLSPLESLKQGGISALSSFVPGGQITIKKPALASTIAGAIEAPVATVAGLGAERIARNIAPEKYKDIAGLSAGIATGAGISAMGTGLRRLGGKLSGRIINSMIGPKQVAFRYGKNPGETVAKLVKPANSLEILEKNIDNTIAGKMDELKRIVSGAKKPVDYSDAMNILDKELSDLSVAPDLNEKIITKIIALKNGILNLSYGKSNLSKLTPEQAVEMKRLIGKQAKWTGGDTPREFEGLIHKIYYSMRTAIEKSVPAAKSLNNDISNLIGASKAMPGAIARGAKVMLPLSAKSIFSTAGGSLLGGMAGGGPLGAGVGFGTNLLLSSPTTGTRISKFLANKAMRKPSLLLGIK